jgi:UDP-2,4-diacetamido-2,4,6-trideoxy-beta-L-altropyranose hydrolase
MIALFRVDASIDIGSGHVMRCITLAKRLMANGIKCIFLSREHAGNLFSTITDNNIQLVTLSVRNKDDNIITKHLSHDSWLGCSIQRDVEESAEVIKKYKPDIIIIDHYAIDEQWEVGIRNVFSGLLIVIDDLYDRRHSCDVLIDQNFGRKNEDYEKLVNPNCVLLIGSKYAIIRDEFLQQVNAALNRRLEFKETRQILITMGGVDQYNYTEKFFDFLSLLKLSPCCEIVIVVGKVFPHLESLKIKAQKCHVSTKIIVNAQNMAELMANSDLAIGAIGSTTWERCTLSLPTINVSIAENQLQIAASLQEIGMIVLRGEETTFDEFFDAWCELINGYHRQIDIASNICDGKGLERVYKKISSIINV